MGGIIQIKNKGKRIFKENNLKFKWIGGWVGG